MRRLHQDLTRRGFDVWWDRTSLPTRQLTFHQEIADAIRMRDRLLLVLGPQAMVSEYVRKEWKFAFALDKPVIPILRVGGYETVPAELQELAVNCDDFRDDGSYAEQLDKLCANLTLPEAPLGKLSGVPTLPDHLIARADLVQEICEALKKHLWQPVAAATATTRIVLHGMGGTGKSILAAVVARERQIRRAYPDGVVWLRVGQYPELVRLQRSVALHLGNIARFNDVREGVDHLREALLDKALLLVLDDIWDSRHLEAFDVLGPRCHALVTTRDAGIVNFAPGHLLAVDAFSQEQSLSFLAGATGVAAEMLPPAAREVVRECGCLPLALSLCAAMARRPLGISWEVLRDTLRRAQLGRIRTDHPSEPRHSSLWSVIHASVEMLELSDRDRWAELTVFGKHRTVPEDVVWTLWTHTGKLDLLGCQVLCKRLNERSLLSMQEAPVVPASAGVLPELWLHDLLYDYASQLVSDRRGLHARLADAALAEYHRTPQAFGGYLKEHLPEHLVEAADAPRLLQVIADHRLDYFHQWAEQGMPAEGVLCLEFLVADLQRAGQQEPIVQALATQLARLYNRLDDAASADRWLAYILKETSEPPQLDAVGAVALHELGSAALSRGDTRKARLAFRQALRIARGYSGNSVARCVLGSF